MAVPAVMETKPKDIIPQFTAIPGVGARGINRKINTYIIRYLMETWDFLVNHIGATAGKIVRITLKALQGSCLKEGFVEGEASRILRTNPTPSTCSNNVQSFKMCLKKGMDTWRRCEDVSRLLEKVPSKNNGNSTQKKVLLFMTQYLPTRTYWWENGILFKTNALNHIAKESR